MTLGGRSLYVTIAVLSLVFVVYSLYRSHQNGKWKLISSCINENEYLLILYILTTADIPYKIQPPTAGKSHYDIYVKIEDEVRSIYLLQTVS